MREGQEKEERMRERLERKGVRVRTWSCKQAIQWKMVCFSYELLMLFIVRYSSIRTSSNSQVGKLTMSEKTLLQTDTGTILGSKCVECVIK